MLQHLAGPIVFSEKQSAAIGLTILAMVLGPLYVLCTAIGYALRRRLVVKRWALIGYLAGLPGFLAATGVVALFGSDAIVDYEAQGSTIGSIMGVVGVVSLLLGVLSAAVIVTDSWRARRGTPKP